MFCIASRSILVAALAAVPVAAQKTLQGFTSPGERSEANHVIVAMENGKFAGLAGGAFINYVPAKWKPEMNDQASVDKLTIGHLFRLGMNNWATLDNYVPMTIGNVTVPVGIWYLGIARDAAGKWSLVVIDPAKAKAAGVTPPMADNAPRTYEVALPVEKVKDIAEKMAVKLDKDEKEPNKGTLSIEFGNMKASVKYELKIAGASEAGAKK